MNAKISGQLVEGLCLLYTISHLIGFLTELKFQPCNFVTQVVILYERIFCCIQYTPIRPHPIDLFFHNQSHKGSDPLCDMSNFRNLLELDT